MPKLTDTRGFYPDITDPMDLIRICERLDDDFTAFDQRVAWQQALDTGMDRLQGHYGRTMTHLIEIGLIKPRGSEETPKTYQIEWDTDDEQPNLPIFSPALYREVSGLEDDMDYWDWSCNYLSDVTGWCISNIGYVPSMSEGDDHVYFAHDFHIEEVKQYIDLGKEGVLLIVGDYIVGCGNKPLYVFIDQEYDEPRDYISIDHTVYYLDTMKSISMSDIEVQNG